MAIAVISHAECSQHGADLTHPENRLRVEAVQNALFTLQSKVELQYYEAPLATREQLYGAHDKQYVDAVFQLNPGDDVLWLDPDTFMSKGSLNAALRAAGANVLAIDLLMQAKAKQVFCNVRPPGHHAEHNKAMGFCLFNNIAVGAAYAMAEYGVERIAIIDFDVHHGNGTEDIFFNNSNVLFCSLFQHPFYPHKGSDTVSDHIVNVPIAAGTRGNEYRELFASKCVPAVEAFEPELLLVSAGFDAHVEDQLAGVCLEDADYAWLGEQIKILAENFCNDNVVFTLEGGYSLDALRRSVIGLVNRGQTTVFM